MAAENRTATGALALHQALHEAPYRFGFYPAMRGLECLHRERPRFGESLRPGEDAVRLGQEPSMAFAPSTLAAFTWGKAGRPPRLEVLFLGLFGPNGPLPLHLTEYARDRLRNSDDETFARFADLFHHRLLSLFFRAWANAEPVVGMDRPESDRFGNYVASLFGLGLPTLRNRDAMPDLAKLHYAAHLACHTRHPEGLRAMIRAFFGLPVRIREFVGHWLQIPPSGRCRLGESPITGTLGASATIGGQVWDCQSRFRIVLGPMGFAEFRGMLPGGESLRRLVAMVRNYLGDQLEWDVQLVLSKDEVPQLSLGGENGLLGWTTWLLGRPPERDVEHLYLDAVACSTVTPEA